MEVSIGFGEDILLDLENVEQELSVALLEGPHGQQVEIRKDHSLRLQPDFVL